MVPKNGNLRRDKKYYMKWGFPISINLFFWFVVGIFRRIDDRRRNKKRERVVFPPSLLQVAAKQECSSCVVLAEELDPGMRRDDEREAKPRPHPQHPAARRTERRQDAGFHRSGPPDQTSRFEQGRKAWRRPPLAPVS